MESLTGDAADNRPALIGGAAPQTPDSSGCLYRSSQMSLEVIRAQTFLVRLHQKIADEKNLFLNKPVTLLEREFIKRCRITTKTSNCRTRFCP